MKEHFVIEKIRLLKEEKEALITLLSEELSQMEELGILPTNLEEAPQLDQISTLSISLLSTRLHKARLLAEYLIKNVLTHVTYLDKKVYDMMSDRDTMSLMRAEINELAQGGKELYEKHRQAILEYHKENETSGMIRDTKLEYGRLLDTFRLSEDELDVLFTGPESHGRYLDLYAHYQTFTFINSSRNSGKNVGYLSFLENFDSLIFFDTCKFDKKNQSYTNFLGELCKYCKSFIEKSFPLVQGIQERLIVHLQRIEKDCEENLYSEEWNQVLAQLSLIQPKSDLYCLPCRHLFTNKSVFEAHLKGKKHFKASEKCKEGYLEAETIESAAQELKNSKLAGIKIIILKEEELKFYSNLLKGVRKQTIENLERKQAMTPEEIEREEEILAQQDEEFFKNDDQRNKKKKLTDFKDELPQELFNGGIYNPLKLPLDWDGKPIPYWLWKLHGLGTKYPCEICGGYEYSGRKAFDSHFLEWRHSHGLKCLGIPNTKHFNHITNIVEAMKLWDRLKGQTRVEVFRPEAMEEVEDHLGNVYTKKTFEDLQKQGLL